MANDFGLKIGIEGEKEFKNALRDINQSFKVLGSEMKLVSSNDPSVFYKVKHTEAGELMECYNGSVAQNNRMTGDFPVFNVGNNTILFDNSITKIEIEPRWRNL